MIDPRLTRLRAGVTGGDDSDEIPPTGFLQHQWAAAVALKVKRRRAHGMMNEITGDGDSSFKQYAPTMTKPLYLTRVLAAAAITGAHHLVINDDVDAIGSMPSLAEAIIDHGHVHCLQRLGSQSGT